MLVFFLKHEVIDLIDPTQLTVKLEPFRYMHRVMVLVSSVRLRLFAFFLTNFLDFIYLFSSYF
jgi:hypothetical protein